MYLKGQEVEGAYDKFDHEFCGSDIPHVVVSDGPRLVMVFSSGELQGRGFKVVFVKCKPLLVRVVFKNLIVG